MMSFEAFTIYYWVIFIWGGLGMLFIAVVSLKELFSQIRAVRKERNRTMDV
ncbi:hypothetical protein [Halalkalibacter akibai]|uniref:Heme exporter protein D n=1 Tax=Halalkalibacter akibai (strain ATCC 43226 / DSM 21942 / CIP 109018 / JCM 9157 / 1139) TaxID=1236973 RepID=W4QYL0_HALA3|nr:hypothetical protein [Halalkalibacter akibai]GAE37171.1 hypothetical protein JCM9157_4428 [Halalkalibacter akibai JCM 9157]